MTVFGRQVKETGSMLDIQSFDKYSVINTLLFAAVVISSSEISLTQAVTLPGLDCQIVFALMQKLSVQSCLPHFKGAFPSD